MYDLFSQKQLMGLLYCKWNVSTYLCRWHTLIADQHVDVVYKHPSREVQQSVLCSNLKEINGHIAGWLDSSWLWWNHGAKSDQVDPVTSMATRVCQSQARSKHLTFLPWTLLNRLEVLVIDVLSSCLISRISRRHKPLAMKMHFLSLDWLLQGALLYWLAVNYSWFS
jgi:hypothetical protein